MKLSKKERNPYRCMCVQCVVKDSKVMLCGCGVSEEKRMSLSGRVSEESYGIGDMI